MTPRSFALIFGLLYTGLGVLGLMPAVSPVVSGLHLVIGLWGLVAWGGWTSPVTYARGATVLFAILTFIGFAYRVQPALGLIALNGYDILLHAGSGLAAAWFGLRRRVTERRIALTDRRRGPRVPVANERRQGFYDRRRSAYV